MLILNEKDILKAITFRQVISAVEDALLLYEARDFHMPLRMHVDYRGDTLLLMPAFTPRVFGTKLVSLFPGNAGKGIPVLKGAMLLNDGETGEPVALLNAAALTALRTGAVGGVGVRYLTPENVQILGVVGAGVQGFHQVLFAAEVRAFSRVIVYDVSPEAGRAFCEKLAKRRPGIDVQAADTVEELTEQSDVIITATTSMKPVLPDDAALLRGKCIVGVGSYKPDMREFPDALYPLLDCAYVDTMHAKEESGDLVLPLRENRLTDRQVRTLGSRIKQVKDGETPPTHETALFKSVGMALFDVVVSNIIFQNAVDKAIGTEVEL